MIDRSVISRALVNLSGSPRPVKTGKGVPVYQHDHFGAGVHGKVVSTKAEELKSDGLAYKEVPLLTGDEPRGAVVKGVAFPKLLDPVDDLPPATVITHARRDGAKGDRARHHVGHDPARTYCEQVWEML